MSTTQVARNGAQGFNGRGTRLNLPQLKEDRKSAVLKDQVLMPDGSFIPPALFHSIRSASHQQFDPIFLRGMAERMRRQIPKSQWDCLVAWMDNHRGSYRDKNKQNDNFLAALLVHAATQSKCTAGEVLNTIMQNGCASSLLPPGK